jgi:hypothetical protein
MSIVEESKSSSESPIILHHLNNSRSQRILWLLEELQVPYNIQFYQRTKDGLAPQELFDIHPLGKIPPYLHLYPSTNRNYTYASLHLYIDHDGRRLYRLYIHHCAVPVIDDMHICIYMHTYTNISIHYSNLLCLLPCSNILYTCIFDTIGIQANHL